MAAEKKFKKDKEIIIEYDNQVKDIRQQLNEQLKCLDTRLETHLALLWELQDFYKRKADVEMEYSRKLDKMVKEIMARHKTEKQRREFWPGYSTYTVWQSLLAATKRQSKDHAILGDLYQTQMVNRFNDLTEDIQRMYRKCREVAMTCHEELLKVLTELQSAMKTYHIYHGESNQAENKLRYVVSQKQKMEQQAKGTLSRRFRNYEKQSEKKQAKYVENKLKALKARNEYLLCLEAANAAVHKYYVDDLPDLIDCMDCGYHNTLNRAMKMHLSAEENMVKSRKGCIDHLNTRVADLDQGKDKQQFLEFHNTPFNLPKKFDFQAHKGDEVCQISAQKPVQDEMVDRLNQLNVRINKLKVENDEVWKTLESAEKSLLDMINLKDYDVTNLFQEERGPPKSPHEYMRLRSGRLETEAFYLEKFQHYLADNNLITRLQAKLNAIQKALGEGNYTLFPGARENGDNDSQLLQFTLSIAAKKSELDDFKRSSADERPPSLPPKPNKRKIGRLPVTGQPKLFGGSIEEYKEGTGQDIPVIVTSCIRVINMYGMHHQGVFRVSGSQHEINDFKNAFEKGEDPLADVADGSDINSIAGVLKLYFRELREPLFPTQLFDELIACSRIDDSFQCITRMKELLSSLPRPILVVMRYLFSFLNHLSEKCDENMMDPYNLAVCFGPTLLRIPPDRDQVSYQQNVNDLMKLIIQQQEDIFSKDMFGGDDLGVMYEKCIVDGEGDRDDPMDNLSDDDLDDIGDASASEEVASSFFRRGRKFHSEPDLLEAVAQYDFTGRTEKELSFKKGDVLEVFKQVSADWWEGALNNHKGLIPDKYIHLRTKEKDSDKLPVITDEDTRRSTESLPSKPFDTGLTEDNFEKSASQPNIAVTPSTQLSAALPKPAEVQSAPSTDSHTSGYSTSSALNSQSISNSAISNDCPAAVDSMSFSALDDTSSRDVQFVSSDTSQTTEELELDIDTKLAEIMSSMQSLEQGTQSDKLPLQKPPRRDRERSKRNAEYINPKRTPDLVRDLPISVEPPTARDVTFPLPVPSDESPTLTTAEVFAKSNQCTIKKGTTLSMPRNVSTFTAKNPNPIPVPIPVQQPVDNSVNAMKRSASSNVGMSARQKASSLPRGPERYSDPSSFETADKGNSKASTLPAMARYLGAPDRSFSPERERSLTPEPHLTDSQLEESAHSSVSKPEKPKPPLRSKPSVARKPAKSPEILKRIQEAQEANKGGPPPP